MTWAVLDFSIEIWTYLIRFDITFKSSSNILKTSLVTLVLVSRFGLLRIDRDFINRNWLTLYYSKFRIRFRMRTEPFRKCFSFASFIWTVFSLSLLAQSMLSAGKRHTDGCEQSSNNRRKWEVLTIGSKTEDEP